MGAAHVLRGGCESRDNWSVVGTEAPIWYRGNVGFVCQPVFLHGGAEEDVVDALVGIFHAVVVRPGDAHGGVARVGIGEIIAIAFGGAGVKEAIAAGAHDGAGGGGVVRVVEIAEDDKVDGGIS